MKATRISTSVSFDYFYSNLDHYGEWIEIDYDLIVWRPSSVHYQWRPYSVGRWAWTSNGWYWDSYEPFGWAVYHYGRWYYDDYYGWVWVPGYEWGPAWVEWRYNDDYLGWAPLPPYASFKFGVGIHFTLDWHSHHRHWNFVRYDRFCHNNVNIYIVNHRNNYNIYRRTKYRTNYYADGGRIINRGVDRRYVERRAGYKIRKSDVSRASSINSYKKSRTVRGKTITSYQPNEKEIKRYRSVEKYSVRKSNGKTSLRKNKIELNRKADKRNDKIRSDKEYKNSRRPEIRKRSADRDVYNSKRKLNNKKEYTRKNKSYKTERKVEKRSSAKSGKVQKRESNRSSSNNKSYSNSRNSQRKSSGNISKRSGPKVSNKSSSRSSSKGSASSSKNSRSSKKRSSRR